MNTFLWLILFLCSFNSLRASLVVFKEASEKEILQNHLIYFYSQELLKAGLFENEALAIYAAKQEVRNQDTDAPLLFFHLTEGELKDGPFGYIALSIDAKTAYVHTIFIEEAYRGKGLGKETLFTLENTLREKGVNAIQLYVFGHNMAAFNLYQKMGYEIEKSYFQNQILIGHQMNKWINSH